MTSTSRWAGCGFAGGALQPNPHPAQREVEVIVDENQVTGDQEESAGDARERRPHRVYVALRGVEGENLAARVCLRDLVCATRWPPTRWKRTLSFFARASRARAPTLCRVSRYSGPGLPSPTMACATYSFFFPFLSSASGSSFGLRSVSPSGSAGAAATAPTTAATGATTS